MIRSNSSSKSHDNGKDFEANRELRAHWFAFFLLADITYLISNQEDSSKTRFLSYNWAIWWTMGWCHEFPEANIRPSIFPSIAFAIALGSARWRAIIEKRFAGPRNIPQFRYRQYELRASFLPVDRAWRNRPPRDHTADDDRQML